jgi:hypothetical protein
MISITISLIYSKKEDFVMQRSITSKEDHCFITEGGQER